MLQESPVTRASLLVRLRDRGNGQAWQEFVDVYGPVVYGFARKRGLQDADAADLMQEVLRSVTNAIARLEYNPAKGSFRGWLFTITRNKVFNFLDSRRRHPRGTGDTGAHAALAAHPDQTPGMEESWQEEYQRRLVALALQTIESEFQARTWQAFRKTTIDGTAITDISAELGMTAGAIYVAKSRVLARLKDEVRRLQEEEEGAP